MSSSSAGDDKPNGLWNQLPSFGPSTDDVREFIQKARFLHGVFPMKDKTKLGPSSSCAKGLHGVQVCMLDPENLIDAEHGMEHLMQACLLGRRHASSRLMSCLAKPCIVRRKSLMRLRIVATEASSGIQ